MKQFDQFNEQEKKRFMYGFKLGLYIGEYQGGLSAQDAYDGSVDKDALEDSYKLNCMIQEALPSESGEVNYEKFSKLLDEIFANFSYML